MMSKNISLSLFFLLTISAIFLSLAPLGASLWYILNNFLHVAQQNRAFSYLFLSLFVAIVSSSIAAMTGYVLHVAFSSLNSFQIVTISLFLALPLLIPLIGVAFGLSSLLKILQIEGSWIWIVVGHFWLLVPIVFFLMGRFRSKNHSQLMFLVRAMPGSFFRRHLYGYVPIFKTPILVSVYIAFIFSLEEGIVAWYVGGFDTTFPIFMVEKLGSSIGAEVIYLGVMLFVLELFVTAFVILKMGKWTSKKNESNS